MRTLKLGNNVGAYVLWLCLFCVPTLAALPSYYVRKDTWHDTLIASREALMKYEEEQAEQPVKVEGIKGVELSVWRAIGPFPKRTKDAFEDVYPPEKEIDLTKTYENGKFRWVARPQWTDGEVYHLQGTSNLATYLYRTLTVKQPRTITGYFGSDDYLTVWLNGEKLLSIKQPRGVGPNQNTAKLNLKAGENKLLIKITNRSGGYGFYFHTRPTPRRGGKKNDPRDGLWKLLQRDFADGASLRQMDLERQDGIWAQEWTPGDMKALAKRYVKRVRYAALSDQAKALVAKVETPADLNPIRDVYYSARERDDALAFVRGFNFQSLRLAIDDLNKTFEGRYPKGADYLKRVNTLEKAVRQALEDEKKRAENATEKLIKMGDELKKLRYEALLANPLLDFDKLMLVKRNTSYLGLPQNWQGNCAIRKTGYDNEIAILSPVSPEGKLATLFKPDGGKFVGDVDLNFDADKMVFSMPGSHGRWQVFEMKADGTNLRQLTPTDQPDFDNFDPCYLPSGKIIYGSTACFQGVPCVGGSNTVANMFLMDADGKNIRQLTFDQDHNWSPAVLNDGRVLYTRWEYSDAPHYFTRLLFRMNPDGTDQMEYYGSNSFWPNSTFYARPIPGHPTKVVAIISGHHGVPRMGEMIIFDPALGRREDDGAVQRIPGYGEKVKATIQDTLVNNSWPKFLHPYPLSEKYFLVSSQMNSRSLWGVYLVDVFDNMLPIIQMDGYALLEPVPLRKTPRPPIIPDKVRLDRKDAIVNLVDVYRGDGLRGVPRGTVKKLRVYELHYAYPRMGGHINIGIDGPWDVHRILGTVPVEEDGSAKFRVPANTPISVQPLDAEGKALQVMRSWYTAMPGENISCIGCHESQNDSSPNQLTIAATKPPSEIEPWYGPPRGFSFPREVQPVLDKYCIGCHNGQQREDGKTIPNFRAKEKKGWRGFDQSYIALHPYVRRPGPESDYHIQPPLEFHADTSELIQMLKKGHHNVKLDAEAWDRLITWIDLNVPDHGTWSEHRQIAANFHQRRLETRKLYANIDIDPEVYPDIKRPPVQTIVPEPVEKKVEPVECPGWPFDAAEAKKRQADAGGTARAFDLSAGLRMEFVLIPPGEFVMGDPNGCDDEYPLTRVKIEQPFLMSKYEVTNAQYAIFDPSHDSRYISMPNKDQSSRGYPANGPNQPVVRVSQQQAMAFCRWLSGKTGQKATLPTEAQWEYACRAGTDTPFNYGDMNTDFGKWANLADKTCERLARRDSPKWHPRDDRFNDGAMVTANVGRYQPNAWGLHDMHGNVCEWTRTTYRPYPYRTDDGRDGDTIEGRKVVRGGSWYDRPHRSRSAFRLSYPSWQVVYNVGFRVICKVGRKIAQAR